MLPPLAVTVAVPPGHNEPFGATDKTTGGSGVTFMVPVLVAGQPLAQLPVTVNAVVADAVKGVRRFPGVMVSMQELPITDTCVCVPAQTVTGDIVKLLGVPTISESVLVLMHVFVLPVSV